MQKELGPIAVVQARTLARRASALVSVTLLVACQGKPAHQEMDELEESVGSDELTLLRWSEHHELPFAPWVHEWRADNWKRARARDRSHRIWPKGWRKHGHSCTPEPVPIAEVSAGDRHTCVLLESGAV